MKFKKISMLLVSALLCGSILAGCGSSNSGPLNGGKSNKEADEEEDEKDEPTDDGMDSNVKKDDDEFADQYALVAKNRGDWYFGEGITAYYTVTDLDGDGLIEVISSKRAYDDNYDNIYNYVGYEVNEAIDGLVELDLSVLTDKNIGIFTSVDRYVSGRDTGYLVSDSEYKDNIVIYNYYLITLEDETVQAELVKGYQYTRDEYTYNYFDAEGEINQDDFYSVEPEGYDYDTYTWISQNDEYEMLYDSEAIEFTELDAYYFAQRAHKLFIDYEGIEYAEDTITIYTDSSSADYKALSDVVKLNEDEDGVPVRFTVNHDMYYQLDEGYYLDEIEFFVPEEYGSSGKLHFNRVYEINLELGKGTDADYRLEIGNMNLLVNEETFGSSKGTYEYKNSYEALKLEDEDIFVKALGISAYELANFESKEDFESDDEAFYKTLAETASFLLGYEEGSENEISDTVLDAIRDSLVYWPTSYYYLDDTNPYIDEIDYYNYTVKYVDYQNALDSIQEISIEEGYWGDSKISYTVLNDAGKEVKISFDIYQSEYEAFECYANSVYYGE